MVGTVTPARQPTASPIIAHIRERTTASRPQAPAQPPRAAAQARGAPQTRPAAQRIPDTRTDSGVPAWKRRVVDELAGELARRGASRGSRIRERLTAENVDARITNMSRELSARAQDRTGYAAPGAARVGVVVNRSA